MLQAAPDACRVCESVWCWTDSHSVTIFYVFQFFKLVVTSIKIKVRPLYNVLTESITLR